MVDQTISFEFYTDHFNESIIKLCHAHINKKIDY